MTLGIHLKDVTKVFPAESSSSGELMTALATHPASDEGEVQGKVAVDQVNLTIKEGERLGIVGRNGAGKSTLLHLIAGISSPTSGSIEVSGKVTSIMTLGTGLRDELTGRECIYVDGEIHGKSRTEVDQIVDQVIDFSELGKFIDYPVRTYSTGMKARLAFSMISHLEPEILIIDEALSVGDATFSTKATARIQEICAKGKIVILVSHSMQSIVSICNRCIYMKDGRVVLDGTPAAVTSAYIDEVRGEDEAALLERFESKIGSRSYQEGYQIKRMALLVGEDNRNSVRVEAEQPLRIQIMGQVGAPPDDLICKVQIVRLDDLLMFEHDFAIFDFKNNGTGFGLEIQFNPLLLGAAIYRLDVSIQKTGSPASLSLAECSSVFEVYSLNPPTGGRPMLYYPMATRISKG